MTAILSATGITAKHGRNTVLHNVDLSLKAQGWDSIKE